MSKPVGELRGVVSLYYSGANSESVLNQLDRFASLLLEWNEYASLVSKGDAETRLLEHFSDSLSLLPYIQISPVNGATLLDIGSGGGFPAIPLKIVQPSLEVLLIERSRKKASFLSKVCASLGLEGTEVVCGSFPEGLPHLRPDFITARAVDKPWKTFIEILDFMPQGCSYLNQLSVDISAIPEGFHVEPISDDTSPLGPRGSLHIITRLPFGEVKA